MDGKGCQDEGGHSFAGRADSHECQEVNVVRVETFDGKSPKYACWIAWCCTGKGKGSKSVGNVDDYRREPGRRRDGRAIVYVIPARVYFDDFVCIGSVEAHGNVYF